MTRSGEREELVKELVRMASDCALARKSLEHRNMLAISASQSTLYRARDYSHTCGQVTRTSKHSASAIVSMAMPAVIGEASGGSDGGGDSGSSIEEGGDGGDGEPPITAGLASSGDHQNNFLSFLILIFVCLDSSFRLVFYLPILAMLAVYRCIPPLPRVWLCLQYIFPDRVRHEVVHPHVRTFFRDRRRARRMRLPMDAVIGFGLRFRTVLLVLLAIVETVKDLFIGDWLG